MVRKWPELTVQRPKGMAHKGNLLNAGTIGCANKVATVRARGMHIRQQALTAHLAPAQQVSQAAHIVPGQAIEVCPIIQILQTCCWVALSRNRIDREWDRHAEDIGRGGQSFKNLNEITKGHSV